MMYNISLEINNYSQSEQRNIFNGRESLRIRILIYGTSKFCYSVYDSQQNVSMYKQQLKYAKLYILLNFNKNSCFKIFETIHLTLDTLYILCQVSTLTVVYEFIMQYRIKSELLGKTTCRRISKINVNNCFHLV